MKNTMPERLQTQFPQGNLLSGRKKRTQKTEGEVGRGIDSISSLFRPQTTRKMSTRNLDLGKVWLSHKRIYRVSGLTDNAETLIKCYDENCT